MQQHHESAGLRPGGAIDATAGDLYQQARKLHQQGELDRAAQLYGEILQRQHRHIDAHGSLGLIYLAQGRLTEASQEFAQVGKIAPQTLDQFLDVLAVLVQVKPLLVNALMRAHRAWPKILSPTELLGPAGIAAIADDAYLRTVLESTVVRDLACERLLTSLRAAILHMAVSAAPPGSDGADLLAFTGALAQQCFINEYVFAVSAAERAEIKRLKAMLAKALGKRQPVRPLWVPALAMYMALHELPEADALLSQAWPEPVAAVVTQQIGEPSEEQALRSSIPRLTAIGDGVTARVRAQYEENPYPRWVRLADAPIPIMLDDRLRQQFPSSSFHPLGERDHLDILVAGCGTGRHVLELAQSCRGARVLAVDLSLASLASAKRRTPPALTDKVEFAQADIFALSSIGRSFDLINASGVLHHMADPLAGWRELVKLMRPNGLMQVGLYSALARRDIIATRSMIAERGYRSMPEGIRRCRQDLLAGAKNFKFMRLNDFFTTSECRDLLFHVHERQLTIPEIKSFLAENDLTFIGFEFHPPQTHERYRRLFAEKGWRLDDLDRWDALERENPNLFAAMYIFWIQKS